MKKKILIVFGTRPEAIKLAFLIKALKKNFLVKVCVTTQHKQMLKQVLKIFKIKINFDLNCMKINQTLTSLSSEILKKISNIYKSFKPDLTIVQGDTASAFIGAYSSFVNGIKVAHIEAGLRTHNLKQPFPEEGMRQLISRISDFHFAPTYKNKISLKKENINKNVFITGNTSIDTIIKTKKIVKNFSLNKKIKSFINKKKIIILVTLHRREIHGEELYNIAKSIDELTKELENIQIILPIHPNPNIRKVLISILSKNKKILIINPLDYFQFVKLMSLSYIILTDSGGIQEEAPSLNIPILVCRKTTERSEAIKSGAAKLIGTDPKKLKLFIKKLIKDQKFYKSMTNKKNPYGDGTAVKKIVKILNEKI